MLLLIPYNVKRRSASKALQGMRQLHSLLTTNYMEQVQGQALLYKTSFASLQRHILQNTLCAFIMVVYSIGVYPARIGALVWELLGSRWQLPKSAGCDWFRHPKAIAHL